MKISKKLNPVIYQIFLPLHVNVRILNFIRYFTFVWILIDKNKVLLSNFKFFTYKLKNIWIKIENFVYIRIIQSLYTNITARPNSFWNPNNSREHLSKDYSIISLQIYSIKIPTVHPGFRQIPPPQQVMKNHPLPSLLTSQRLTWTDVYFKPRKIKKMRAFLITTLFVTFAFSKPIENGNKGIETFDDIEERKVDPSEDLEAARNAKFNFGYSIQVM